MVLKLVKKYENGASHTLFCRDHEEKAEIARVDAEDRAALVDFPNYPNGVWEITVHRVY